MNQESKFSDLESSGSARRAVLVLLLWGGALVVAGLFPQGRVWGLHYLGFAGPMVRWGFAGAFVLSVVYVAFPDPLFDRWAGSWRRWPRFARGRSGGAILVIAVAIAGWLLRARVPFLGDGTLRAQDAVEGATWYPSEIIPTYLSALFARELPTAWGIDGFGAVGLVSLLSGVLLAAGLWWLVPRADERGGRQAIFWILTFGTVRLFAGYIETYATGFAAVTLWTLACVACRRGELGWGWPVVFWCLAIGSHVTAIVLVPATFWVLLVEKRNTGLKSQISASRSLVPRSASGETDPEAGTRGTFDRVLPTVVYGLVAVVLGGGVVAMFRQLQVVELGAETSHFLLPLLPQTPHNYGLVSAAHLLDFANGWLLLVPALFVGLLVAWRPRRAGAPMAATGETEAWWRSGRMFWVLAAGLPLAGAFLVDPKLGWARDWDLFALFCAPALTGAALWLSRLHGAARRSAAAVAVLSAGLWLVYSVDGTAELRRFEALLDLDQSRSDYGHEILGQHYRRRGDHLSSIRHYEKALAVSENTRYRISIASAYYQMGRDVKATRWYQDVTTRDTMSAEGFHGLALALDRQRLLTTARDAARRATLLGPDDPKHSYELAKLTMEMGEIDTALPLFERNARMRPLEAYRIHGLGVCYLALRRLPEARMAFAQALRLEPDNTTVILDAARVALLERDLASAGDLLARYRDLTPLARRNPDFRPLVDTLAALTGRR